MYSTVQAAQLLGVSRRRIDALIAAGDLDAEKLGGRWFVSEESVKQRLETPRLKGRPRGNERDQRKIKDYVLMCKNEPVLSFAYNDACKVVLSIKNDGNLALAPVGACKSPGKPGLTAFSSWLSERYIPENRINLEQLLNASGYDSPEALMFKSFGLNLTDQYWFMPQGADIDWHDINFFENGYEGDKSAQGPGSGTPGALPKWWEKRGSKNVLVKGSSMGQREPYAELAATKLYERLLNEGDYVAYSIEYIDDKPHSICEGFIGPDTQLVTMRDLTRCYSRSFRGNLYEGYRDLCVSLGIEDAGQKLAKMLVCDFLDANLDRHDMNLGAIRSTSTGDFLGIAPIFDSGRSFFFDAQRKGDFRGGPYFHTSHPFSEYPSTQLAMVLDYSWFDVDSLGGFGDDLADILSQNEVAPSWYSEEAAKQFGIQLERVLESAREHGWA